MLAIFWMLLLEFSSTHHIKAFPRSENCVVEAKDRLNCSKHLPSEDAANFPADIKVLELRNVEKSIDLKVILKKFPEIEDVLIVGGSIHRITEPNRNNKIRVLQLVHVGVENIGPKFLSNFPNLETLNLQGNYLQKLASNFSLPKLKNLYLADNRWNCSKDLDWVLLHQDKIKDLQNLTCYGNPHAKRSLLTIANFMKDIKNQCPSQCACSLPKVVLKQLDSDQLEPVVEVNCSYRGLSELPLDLPQKTKIIHLEGNEIEDLKPLKHSPIYLNALELYLDNNKVNSIEELEGSYWLRHFRVFSLSGNKLTEIPTYALVNALEVNPNMPSAVRISLGGNPWRCDCVFTPNFQAMLQEFASQIQDISEVKCSYVEGDENSLLPIIELSRSSVCRSPTEYSVQALDLLNGVLASLILLILGKLAFDYYYFKKTGRLPWIVTKMP